MIEKISMPSIRKAIRLMPGSWITLACMFGTLIIAVFSHHTLLAADNTAKTALAELAKQVATAEKESRAAIVGRDGWLFFVPEIRSLSIGTFWGPAATNVSRATKPAYADPLPAIVDFHHQLKGADIELLVVPVPGKAAVYPEAISAQIQLKKGEVPERVDVHQQEFYRLLKEQGVQVIDLVPPFFEYRSKSTEPLFCKSDTHWSGRGIELAADVIAREVQDRPWLKHLPALKLTIESRPVEITGDLARMVSEKQAAKETVALNFVGTKTGDSLVPVAIDRQSPVLLLGDSYTLIFHDPQLYAQGAGLPDQLARRLGCAVDLIGVRGSGATTTRIDLLRRNDNLRGKKLVIWCFSFREFTESTTGWRKLPVIK